MKISPADNNTINLNPNQAQSNGVNRQVKAEVPKDIKKRSAVNNESNEEIRLEPEKLQELVKAANEVMDAMDKKMDFSIHEGTGRTMVKIVDRSEGKIIREIPPEKMLDLVAKMWEVVGLFVDERA